VSESFRGLKIGERLDIVYRIEWGENIQPWVEVLPLTKDELMEGME